MTRDLPRRPEPLPVAGRGYDAALLRQLAAQRSALCAHAVVLVDRARYLQSAIANARWYSKRDLHQVQRHAVTALRAARCHHDLPQEVLAALDSLQEFTRGEPVSCSRRRQA